MEILIVVKSTHHKNTEKLATVFADILTAELQTPRQVDPNQLHKYDLVGLGSGIYSDNHHKSILNLVDSIPQVINKKAFIFSTAGTPGKFAEEFVKYTAKAHLQLRQKLQSKGYSIVDEFSCPGFNTNSFLRFFGGINKGRPNAEDLKQAEEFALNLKHHLQSDHI
jgi:flavodoxin